MNDSAKEIIKRTILEAIVNPDGQPGSNVVTDWLSKDADRIAENIYRALEANNCLRRGD